MTLMFIIHHLNCRRVNMMPRGQELFQATQPSSEEKETSGLYGLKMDLFKPMSKGFKGKFVETYLTSTWRDSLFHVLQ